MLWSYWRIKALMRFAEYEFIGFYFCYKFIDMNEEHSMTSLPKNIPLSTGLDIVGRIHLVASEWTGKFANHQQKHAPVEIET